MKVIILAGGLGTRLSEYTKALPKPMVTINGKPILLHIMKQYAKYGFKDFYVANETQTIFDVSKIVLENKYKYKLRAQLQD